MEEEDILDITEKPIFEESITKYEYHSYQPFSNTAVSNNDEIRIAIQHQDLYSLPSESLLYLEGKILRPETVQVDQVALINNWPSFLFDEIRYELNSVEVDKSRNPGITSSLKGYLSFTPCDIQRFENAGWTENGMIRCEKFDVCVPLKILLGFAEDYRKIIINCRQELILQRTSVDLNALISDNEAAKSCSVELHKVTWKMPHVSVEDSVRLRLLKTLDSSRPIYISFRSWEIFEYPYLPKTTKHSWSVKTSSHTERPRYVIVAFQKNRKNEIKSDMSKFDHCALTSMKLYLNSESYPYDNLAADFKNDKYAILYQMYASFRENYYHNRVDGVGPVMGKSDFKEHTPMVVIDCSRQNESVKNAPVDIRIEFETDEAIPDGTSAYCLIIHDKLLEYNALTNHVHKII